MNTSAIGQRCYLVSERREKNDDMWEDTIIITSIVDRPHAPASWIVCTRETTGETIQFPACLFAPLTGDDAAHFAWTIDD